MGVHGGIAAISFDFFNTIAHHRSADGRGAQLAAYFAANDWVSTPWEHSVLYDVFEHHGRAYEPDATQGEHEIFCEQVAATLFRRMRVQAPPGAAQNHALNLWRILGPDHLALFAEVRPTFLRLKAAGFRLAIVSNWQRGLDGFCQRLGLGEFLDLVITSADIGAAKPDRRIFDALCNHLALGAENVLHIGDHPGEDWEGARNAGLEALLLRRGAEADDGPPRTITDLGQVPEFLGVA